MADPKHPRHYDEAFKRQIVPSCESGKPSRKIRRRGPDILRTTELGCSNARLEASDNRIKVTIRMAYGFHHANNPIALIMLRRGGLDIRPPQPRTQPTKTAEASYVLDISAQRGRCNRSITV